MGQGEAVVGARAAADLVHQDQALRSRVVQDVGGFAHLDHEGRLAAREVVAGADAGEDAVDRPDRGACGGNETADVGKQHDQRVLAHVGRLAAHVRAGHDQHAACLVELEVVRLERLVADLLDHGVAAPLDMDAAVRTELRT